jgi:hypothetical protein
MYGFWRLGLRPAPSAGATCVSKGLATATRRNAKNPATSASTGTAHAITSLAAYRLNSTAAAHIPVRTSSHRRSEPAWPPQNADSV